MNVYCEQSINMRVFQTEKYSMQAHSSFQVMRWYLLIIKVVRRMVFAVFSYWYSSLYRTSQGHHRHRLSTVADKHHIFPFLFHTFIAKKTNFARFNVREKGSLAHWKLLLKKACLHNHFVWFNFQKVFCL